jgi:hypothetical protein
LRATRLLGRVQGPVGGGEHGVGAVPWCRQRHADRQRGHHRLAAQLDGAADGPQHPFGQAGCLGRSRHRVRDQDELVPAEPAHDVGVPGRQGQASSDLDEQLVPGRVPQRVVDLLEVIHVAEQHGGPASGAPAVGQGLAQLVEHQRAVGQPGELIMGGGVHEPCLHPPQQRDVLDLGENQSGALTGLGGQQGAVDPAPHLAAVGPDEVHFVLVRLAGRDVGGPAARTRIGSAELCGRAADQLIGVPSEQLLAGRVHPGDAAVLGQQRDGDRRAVEHGPEQLLRVRHQGVHAGMLDGQRGMGGELLEQPAALRVRAPAPPRHVDAQHADQGAVRSVQRRQQDIVRVPGVGVVARRDGRHPGGHRPGKPLIAAVIEEPQLAPGLAAGQDLAERLHRRAGPEQRLPGLFRSHHRGHLAHVTRPDHVDHGAAESQLVDHGLHHELQGLPQIQARGDAPDHVREELSRLRAADRICHAAPVFPDEKRLRRDIQP